MNETTRRVFEQALDRELFPEELTVLTALSPQGVAKVNSDLSRGSDLQMTLEELMSAYCDLQQRRNLAARQVPLDRKAIARRISRPLTADELVLLSEVPPLVLTGQIGLQLQKGELLEDILEEMAHDHRLKQLAVDAQMLSLSQPLTVAVSRLAPTVRRPSSDPL
eukprot:RCo021513